MKLSNRTILITEGSRGEGGIMTNKDGYRYLQDYNLGPPDPWPRLKAMELGPRDRLSQAFWHEQRKGRTIKTPYGDVVHLDIRHLGEKKINERLPMVRELAQSYAGVDPVHEPIPVRPVVHYTMGGIHTDLNAATSLAGLFAAGECACVSINGANRLGSNSLTELLVFGARAGRAASAHARANSLAAESAVRNRAQVAEARIRGLFTREGGTETVAGLRKQMHDTIESGAGIYRSHALLQETCGKLAELRLRYEKVQLQDRSNVFNTDLTSVLELGAMLEVAAPRGEFVLDPAGSGPVLLISAGIGTTPVLVADSLSALSLALIDHSMLDWPEQTQTSPTRTSLYSILFLPLMVIGSGPPAAPESSLTIHSPLSPPASVTASWPRKVTVTASPGSALPQMETSDFCWSTMPSLHRAWGLTSARAAAGRAARLAIRSNIFQRIDDTSC